MVTYKWYILPIGGLYGTYHLLREPETTIGHMPFCQSTTLFPWFSMITNFFPCFFPAKRVSLRPWKISKLIQTLPPTNCRTAERWTFGSDEFPTKAWKKCKIVSVSQPNTARCNKKKGGEKRDPFESLLRWNNHLLKVAKGAKFDHKRIHVFGTKAACRVSDVS